MPLSRLTLLALCAPAIAAAQATSPVASDVPAAAVPPAPAVAPMIAGRIAPPPPGQGQVVFFRKGGFVGSMISCAVHENGVKLTSLPPGRYVALPATPGVHSYAVKSEATDTLRMEIEPDETYFAKCAITMGVMAGRPNLSPSDEAAFTGMKLKLVTDKKTAAK